MIKKDHLTIQKIHEKNTDITQQNKVYREPYNEISRKATVTFFVIVITTYQNTNLLEKVRMAQFSVPVQKIHDVWFFANKKLKFIYFSLPCALFLLWRISRTLSR